MHTLEIHGRQDPVEVPATWHEMDPAQRARCLELLIHFKFGVITYEECLVGCFFSLARILRDLKTITWEKLAGKQATEDKNTSLLINAEKICTFHTINRQRSFELSYTCEIPPFTQCHSLHGPDALLSNITLAEFRYAILEMNEYFASQDVQQLARFVACLYRPQRKRLTQLRNREDFDGHLREPFNPHRLEVTTKAVARWPDWQKMAVLLWFTHCTKVIQTEELIINGREVCFAELFPRSEETDEDTPVDRSSPGWSAILNTIAKEGIYGPADKTDKQPLFDILLYMLDQHERSKELEAKYRSARTSGS